MKALLLQPVRWGQVGIVVGIFALVALVFVALILLVARICKKPAEGTLESVLSHLAGANCGGCGYACCSDYAQRLYSGNAALSDCRVTAEESKREIASLLGVPYGAQAPTVSVCRCHGGLHAKSTYDYVGAHDCAEQIALFGGKKACKYGCVGEGNCVRSCPHGAIHLREECATVNPDECTSCGACIHECPRGLFLRIPADAKVYVACASKEKGKKVTDQCEYGCIACGRCAKVCPSGAITLVENLPVIDYARCVKCGKCANSCPRHTIITRY